MRKLIKLISIVFSVISILILTSNQSNAICNTIQFTKEVSAVQLILADGRVLYDIKVDKNVETQDVLREVSYKDLNLVFVVETENGVEENKLAINQFINKVYDLYGDNANKIRIGIVPFEDLSEKEISERTEENEPIDNFLKNSKDEAINELNNIEKDNNRTLQEALVTAEENLLDNANGRK